VRRSAPAGHGPQVLPLHLRAPAQAGAPPLEANGEQQGWPDLPHALQMVAVLQNVPLALHTRPEQHAWPRAPHPPHDPSAAQLPVTDPQA
jgi:hypothetical protein